MFFRIIYESIVQALQSLFGNKLRTFLSLLGISIGIFCVVAVKSAVDSLQQNMDSGFAEIGQDVVYVRNRPFVITSYEEYLEYSKRPRMSIEDYDLLKDRVKSADLISYDIHSSINLIKFRSNEVENAGVMGTSYAYNEIHQMDIEKGRYFTQKEVESGANKVILGSKMAENLFESLDPLGREVKISGLKFQVIGVLKYEGESSFNFVNYDETVWMPHITLRKIINDQGNGTNVHVGILGKKGVTQEALIDELTGIMRAIRKMKPRQEDNFSLATLSELTSVIKGVTDKMNVVGGIVGVFSLIIGMFSVANIMFVTVKERTNIIGVKKALGAKNGIILLEFLIEAIVLCLVGGLIGIGLVKFLGTIVNVVAGSSFKFFVNPENIILGVAASVLVGIISGLIPAIQASRMDPVEAIRG